MNTQNNKTNMIAYGAILAALAMIFSYIEAIIPFNFGIPGVKLGLANLVIIIALYKLNFRYAFLINIIRIITVGLLFTGVFGALYSLAGGILSLLVMTALKKLGWFSIIGVSMAGGVAHNLGQVTTAYLLLSSPVVFAYFPALLFSGMITGIIIGVIAYNILNHLPEINR